MFSREGVDIDSLNRDPPREKLFGTRELVNQGTYVHSDDRAKRYRILTAPTNDETHQRVRRMVDMCALHVSDSQLDWALLLCTKAERRRAKSFVVFSRLDSGPDLSRVSRASHTGSARETVRFDCNT